MLGSRISNKRTLGLASLLVIAALLLAACQPAATTPAATISVPSTGATVMPTVAPTTAITPSVTVSDQAVENDTVTIADVVSNGPGWIVIHISSNGAPGPVVGYAPVVSGDNKDVMVKIDTSKATETLFAMLHTDAGVVGTYEFPGADVPVQVSGAMVNPSFKVTNLTSPTSMPMATSMPQPTAMATQPSAGEQAAVSLVGTSFTPKDLTIKAGTTVVWTNTSNLPHTVTADDGSFDSGSLSNGGTFQHTFTAAGTFPYYCKFHGGPGGSGMSGTITVTP